MRKDNNPEKDNPLRMDNEETYDTTQEIGLNPDGTYQTQENVIFDDREYVVNIGPQHPATHGVMRFRVSLEGETIRKLDANCGYIHRGIEKMNENLTYPQTLALTDRLDYLGAHQNRHALCMCIEKAMGIEVSERVKYIRTIMDELQRIDSHLLFYSCLAMDLGALTAFFYGFRDREMILDMFEETCGGRLIMNYNTIGGVQADLHPNFIPRVKNSSLTCVASFTNITTYLPATSCPAAPERCRRTEPRRCYLLRMHRWYGPCQRMGMRCAQTYALWCI